MSEELFSIQGKSVLVTGGSRGVGSIIARGCIAAGARVLISSRKAEACDAMAAELSALGECVSLPADVSTRAGARGLAESVFEQLPEGLDVLINNAGATWGASIDEFPEQGWDKVLAVNLKGVFELTTALLPALRRAAEARGPARVINVGSAHGIVVPALESYPYSASKAAVHMLTRHLAKRLAGEGITVNAIAPGPFESDMSMSVLATESGHEALLGDVPLDRLGEPDEIVGPILMLASRAGAYMTGAVVAVDGGLSGCA